MSKIVDQSNYVPSIGADLDKVENPPVQRDGYRTIEQQVREFEIAGENLEEFRRLTYQYEGPGAEEIEEVSLFDDPESSPADIVRARRAEVFNKNKVEEKKKEEPIEAKKEDKDASAPVADSGS